MGMVTWNIVSLLYFQDNQQNINTRDDLVHNLSSKHGIKGNIYYLCLIWWFNRMVNDKYKINITVRGGPQFSAFLQAYKEYLFSNLLPPPAKSVL